MHTTVADSWQWHSLTSDVREVIQRHQRSAPVDLVGLTRDLGLTVKAATLAPGKSGEIRPYGPDRYIIRVNRHDNPARQRFTVAHEIAHYLLHRPLIGTGISDDALYRSNQSSSIEAEANRLASDIIMPANLVNNALAVAHTLGVTDVREALADTFKVSPAAMGIKLGIVD
ncbi:hypothetical protein ASE95_10775 [Sphingomonas sp. Leaf231]|uniref:ImmA/IrrE family metallo-endopeptidase n=1 Tax=Sphingomonas sp. Leaf231 TaxID=1736301 RepID=UPI0006F343D7|nr:ImmA/IrrE family metallo-endopeptidase [Sphingomonas sp. Leaf231]KQN93057.1 hypothetical protein ASE95_10775 [Sphingomonas sp. Leaf231]